jgi:hypothetical protein
MSVEVWASAAKPWAEVAQHLHKNDSLNCNGFLLSNKPSCQCKSGLAAALAWENAA